MKLGIRDINKTAEEDGTSVSVNMLSIACFQNNGGISDYI
jgi:hypothetical protein